nr:copia protein [Tanacetum cinerariifolium]
QWHKAFYRKSDLFFVCIMRPSPFDIQIQESKIKAAKIEQYKTEIKRLKNMNIGTTKSASRLVEPIHPRYVDSVLGYEKEKMKCCEIKHKSPKQASSRSLGIFGFWARKSNPQPDHIRDRVIQFRLIWDQAISGRVDGWSSARISRLSNLHERIVVEYYMATYYGCSHSGRALYYMLLAYLSLLYDDTLMLTASFSDFAVMVDFFMCGLIRSEVVLDKVDPLSSKHHKRSATSPGVAVLSGCPAVGKSGEGTSVVHNDGKRLTPKTYEELFDKEKLQADCDLKATNIVLKGLPTDVYSLINHHKVSKYIWDRVKLLMQGTSLSKQECQAKVVKCYNCQGEGHMARQCTQPKRRRDATWFKEKVLLVQARAEGKELNEEKLAFIADLGVADGQVAQTITHNAAFQTDDLDAYDSDYDDISSAKAILMENLSSCDSDVLSEVPYSDTYQKDMMNQSVQELQYSEQSPIVDYPDNKIPNEDRTLLLNDRLCSLGSILNVDSPPPTRSVDGIGTTYPPTTAEEKLARKNELKARGLDQIYDRLQKLKSQLEIHGETISQEDLNMKLLRSLPSEWKTHTLIWRNKPDLETLSMDDLYNNLKIYEAEVIGSSSTTQNTQNVAFMSSNNTDSTNKAVNTAHGVFTASFKTNASNLPNVDSLSDAVIYSFFASQSNSSQLYNEDLKQIDPDDLKEMKLQWQMAMLTMRARRFLQKTGRNLGVKGTETISFDMTKVKCYNYQRGHFAKECRAPKRQDNRNKEAPRRVVPVEDTTLNALVSQCAYKAGLESVDARLEVYKKNESVFEEDIKILKLDVMFRDKVIIELRQKFKKAKKERDDLKLTLEKFKGSSKNLSRLLDSQQCDKSKTGLGKSVKKEESNRQTKYPRKNSQSPREDPSYITGGELEYPRELFLRVEILKRTKVILSLILGQMTYLVASLTLDSANSYVMHGPICTQRRFPWLGVCIPPRQGIISQGVSLGPVFLLGLSDTMEILEFKTSKNRYGDNRMSDSIGGYRIDNFNVHNWYYETMRKLKTIQIKYGGSPFVVFEFLNLVQKAFDDKLGYPLMIIFRDEHLTHSVPRELVYFLVVVESNRDNTGGIKVGEAIGACSGGIEVKAYSSSKSDGVGWVGEDMTVSSYEVLEGFWRGDVVRLEKEKQGGEVATWWLREGNPQQVLQEKGVIDSGCSRHMTRNMLYLSEYKEIDYGYVAFGRDPKGGKITDTKCVVLSPNFKLLDESQALLRVLRKNNMYNVDLRNDAPSGGNQTNGNAGSKSSKDEVAEDARKKSTEVSRKENKVQDPAKEEDTTDTGIFSGAYDDKVEGAVADFNNLDLTTVRRTNQKDYQNCLLACFLSQMEPKKMDVKSVFLYGTIEEEVYVCQPLGFEDPYFPNKVYKAEKALYGLHQAPRAWYETLSTYLLENGFRREIIDKTLFIKKDKGDILLVHVYVDDIIFRSTKNSLCKEFKGLMYKKFQIRSMMELTFFLGLQVMQKDDGIFISQDKYVADILKKFDFSSVKTTSTPIETNKALLKDEEAVDVDVHLYRSIIGSLMYLTASRPDIMFVVCACARFQVTPKG